MSRLVVLSLVLALGAVFAPQVPGLSVATMQDELVQVGGSLNGVEGIFDWIVRNGQVVHRWFIPRGLVNGVPNQVPPPPLPRVP